MIGFGDVFRYREAEYVYLIQVDDVVFAAKIMPRNLTDELIRIRDKASQDPKRRAHERKTFCFVILSTQEFESQGAHYATPPLSTDTTDNIRLISTLNEVDIKALKKEIIEDVATFPVLRETIKRLFKE